jgi:hypothetical protein
VKAFRASPISRCLVVAVMLLSWLVVTNHCALGGMLAKTACSATHTHCHAAANDSGKKAPGDGMRECCQTIKASLADRAEFDFAAAAFQFQVAAIFSVIVAPVTNSVPGLYRDHGPPRASSFAEIVLQRSLLSHAPPILA